jgi:hypothetical protein
MMHRKFRKGALVELMVDANVIPAGRYRFLEHDGEMLIFSVAPEIIVGINSTFWGRFVRPVFDVRAVVTTPRVFMKKYRSNVVKARGVIEALCPDKFTFCILGLRYYRMMTQAEQQPVCAATIK